MVKKQKRTNKVAKTLKNALGSGWEKSLNLGKMHLPGQANILLGVLAIFVRYIAWLITFVTLLLGLICWQVIANDRQLWVVDDAALEYVHSRLFPHQSLNIEQMRIEQVNGKMDIKIASLSFYYNIENPVSAKDVVEIKDFEGRFYLEDFIRGEIYPRYLHISEISALGAFNTGAEINAKQFLKEGALIAIISEFHNSYDFIAQNTKIASGYRVDNFSWRTTKNKSDSNHINVEKGMLTISQGTPDLKINAQTEISYKHDEKGININQLPIFLNVDWQHADVTLDEQISQDFQLQLHLYSKKANAKMLQIAFPEIIKNYGLRAENLNQKLREPLDINLTMRAEAGSYRSQMQLDWVGGINLDMIHPRIDSLLVGDDVTIEGEFKQWNLLNFYIPLNVSLQQSYWADMNVSGNFELVVDNKRVKNFQVAFEGTEGALKTPFFKSVFDLQKWQLDAEYIKRIFGTNSYMINYHEPLRDVKIKSDLIFDTDAKRNRHFRIDYEVEPVFFESLLHYWPTDYVPATRKWFTDNVQQLKITEVNGEIDYVLDGDGNFTREKLTGKLLVDEVRLRPEEDLPVFHDIAGEVTFTDTDIDIAITQVSHPEITIAPETIKLKIRKIPNDIILQTSLDLTSDLGTVLDLAKLYEPSLVDYEEQLAGLSGDAALSLRLQISLDDSDNDQFDLLIAGDVNNIDFDIPGFSLNGGNGDIRLTGDDLDIKLAMLHGSSELLLDWQETFYKDRLITLDGNLSANQLMVDIYTQLAVDFTGDIPVKGEYIEDYGKQGTIEILADMTQAAIAMEPLYISKRKGQEGKISLKGITEPTGEVSFNDVEIDFAGLTSTGNIDFDTEGRVFIVLPDLSWGRSQMFLDGVVEENGDTFLVMEGKSFDLSGLLEDGGSDWLLTRLESDGSDPSPGIIALEGGYETVYFQETDDVYAENARYNIFLDQYTSDLSWDMPYAESDKLSIAFANDIRDKTGNLRMDVSSLEELDKLISNTQDFAGGRLKLTSQRNKEEPYYSGRLETGALTIYGSPILGTILETISLVTLNVSVLQKGYQTQGFFMDFNYDDEQRVIVRNMRLYSLAQGVTGSGVIDLGKSEIDMQGSVIPLYTLSVILGKTPILGPLLIGDEKDGLFGVRYWATGEFEDIKVRVNPLEALLPGFVRNIRDTFITSPEEQALLDNAEKAEE